MLPENIVHRKSHTKDKTYELEYMNCCYTYLKIETMCV